MPSVRLQVLTQPTSTRSTSQREGAVRTGTYLAVSVHIDDRTG